MSQRVAALLRPDAVARTVARLARYRVAQDLTYAQLAAAMAARGCRVTGRTLQRALTRRGSPKDRTVFQLTCFLAEVARGRRPAPRPRRRGRRRPRGPSRRRAARG